MSLTDDKKRNRKIECFYTQLQNALPPPPKLTLPYTANKQQRKAALIERLAILYDDLDSNEKKASYKSIHGYYQDTKKGVAYPYFWEILAIPFVDPTHAKKRIDFIGAINYSISPKTYGSLFEGEYKVSAYNLETEEYIDATNILGVLEHYGFHDYTTDSAKIPCIVVANLVTPRRDPDGQDKSRIDTNPFTETIMEGVKRIASEIKSFRALGYTFRKPEERRNAIRLHSSGKKSLKDLLTNYLREEHGLATNNKNNNTSDYDYGYYDEEDNYTTTV